MYKKVEALALHSRLRSAGIMLSLASASYDIWWTYKGESIRDLNAMNEYPNFFRYDEEAHFRNMIVGLYTLYDAYPKTLTIKSLIQSVEPDKAVPILRQYESTQIVIEKIATLRHNLFGHRSQSQTYDNIYCKAQLKPDDLKLLIQNSLAILVAIADAINAQRPTICPFVAHEVVSLVRQIKAH